MTPGTKKKERYRAGGLSDASGSRFYLRPGERLPCLSLSTLILTTTKTKLESPILQHKVTKRAEQDHAGPWVTCQGCHQLSPRPLPHCFPTVHTCDTVALCEHRHQAKGSLYSDSNEPWILHPVPSTEVPKAALLGPWQVKHGLSCHLTRGAHVLARSSQRP